MRTPLNSLRALQSFLVIVETGSFTAAAKQLNYSQSAISNQIQRLEENVGMALLARSTRYLTPTPAGRDVIGYAREMLRLDAEMMERLSSQDIAGKVRLGLPADFAVYMPETLAMFSARHPRVELEVRSGLSDYLSDQVSCGEIDMAVVTRTEQTTSNCRLRTEPLVWVSAKGSNAHTREPLPLALWPDGICTFRTASIKALESSELSWRVGYESESFDALRASVLAGLAITVAIPSMVDDALEILDPGSFNLPELPSIHIELVRGQGPTTRAIDCLAELIEDRVRAYRALAPA